MAKLGEFRRNKTAMMEGEWINPGPEYAGLEIKTKAMGTRYADARGARLARAAREAGGERKVGQAVRNKIDIEALIEVSLLDVRGLVHDDKEDGTPGDPVTFPEFCDLIKLVEHAELASACFLAAGSVGQKQDLQKDDAEGN